MNGMFVSRSAVDSVAQINGQNCIVDYLASKQAWIDAQDELRAWRDYYEEWKVAGIIDRILVKTPVGPPWTRRI